MSSLKYFLEFYFMLNFLMSAILALYKEFNKWNLIHSLILIEWNFKVK